MDQNIEAMYEHFTNVWNADVQSIVPGYPVEIRYQGNIYPEPDRSKYWCRLSTVTLRAEQATLSASVGEPGKKRYKVRGMIFAQIFGPRQDIGAWNTSQSLAKLAQKAFRQYTPTGNVWFQNATVENFEPEDNWVRFNASAGFTFDEFQ